MKHVIDSEDILKSRGFFTDSEVARKIIKLLHDEKIPVQVAQMLLYTLAFNITDYCKFHTNE